MGGTRMNVYQALRERIRRIFGEYDYVYLSFSGGKDSGVLLNACVEHIRQYGGRMGVFHMDYEFQECFSFWLRKQLGVQKVACLVGIRTQESFNR